MPNEKLHPGREICVRCAHEEDAHSGGSGMGLDRRARCSGGTPIRHRPVLAKASAGRLDHWTDGQHLRGRARPPDCHKPARYHGRGGRDIHAGAIRADLRSGWKPGGLVGRLEHRTRHDSRLLRRSREQHLAHGQWRRHHSEMDARRHAAHADRQARSVRQHGRHQPRQEPQRRSQIGRENFCASGVTRRRKRNPSRVPAPPSRKSFIAS